MPCVWDWLGTILPAPRGLETAFFFPHPLDLTRDCWSKTTSASPGIRHPPPFGMKITRTTLPGSRGLRPASFTSYQLTHQETAGTTQNELWRSSHHRSINQATDEIFHYQILRNERLLYLRIDTTPHQPTYHSHQTNQLYLAQSQSPKQSKAVPYPTPGTPPSSSLPPYS